MKFLLTTTFFAAALVHCAYAASEDVPEHGVAVFGQQKELSDADKLAIAAKQYDADRKREHDEATTTTLANPDGQDEDDYKSDGEAGGLDADEDEPIILMSCDEENPVKFKVPRKAALMCNLVKNIIEGDKTASEIEIKKVTAPILNLVVEYLKHHNGKVPDEIKKPIQSIKMEKIVDDEWDAEFINKQTKKVIFQIILGANYMDIKCLLHLGCAKIATLIKGKSPEEIKKILGDDEDGGDAKQDNRRRRRLVEAMSQSSF